MTLASLTETWLTVWQFLSAPLLDADWCDWRGFWLEQVLDDRFVVIYFLPLVPILLLIPRNRLRIAIILTGLAFVCYAFGVLYAAVWLLTCLALYWFAERFAIECRRTDVLAIGPPLAACAIVGGWYVCTMLMHNLALPPELNAWLFENAKWLFPLGARGLDCEPHFRVLHHAPGNGGPFQLFHAIFWDVHIVGTAYLAVRMLHYFSEIKRGELPRQRRTLLNFMAFVCYGPTLMQGPIERFEPFQSEMDTCHRRRGWHNLPPAAARIGWGVTKGVIATLYFQPILRDQMGIIGADHTYYRAPEQIDSFFVLYFGVFFNIFWLYLEFSGYCDISAGIARLLGYRQIENFNWPWFATSMRDFWRRWHISLSLILRDYVYIALGGNRRHALLNICVTFFLVGIWHKLMPQLGIWGLVMALMVAVNQVWSMWMKRLDERQTGPCAAIRRGWLKLRPLPRICAWLLTQHAFVFSLLIFFGGQGAINVPREILRRVWAWLV